MSFPIISISQHLLSFQRENFTAIPKKKPQKNTKTIRYSQIKTDMNRYEYIVILVNDFFLIRLVTFSERYTRMNMIFAICF